ncbi:MAG: ribbon-helix-helix domain-containing protein [Xenococcaceae cyanobacterium MO_188.B19]|nr:ribbon-helix-helix domain-containing protein [Xenococcaceae cyanobacterium MO_188.B19]
MPTKSINITIDQEILAKLDSIVANKSYPNRSRIIEEAIKEKLQILDEQIIGEQAKLLAQNEAEEWLEGELELWQEEY